MAIENPINARLSIVDSFLIKFNSADSHIHNTTREYKSRTNMETIVMVCNWLIESHEALGTDHGFLRSNEEEIAERDSVSIISKLNIIINLMSESLSGENETLTNLRFNALGVLPIDQNCNWEEVGTMEIIVSSAIRKKLYFTCRKVETVDGNVWALENLCTDEIELLDKMVFLLHRNNHHQNH